MTTGNLKRILYLLAAIAFLAMAGYQYSQAGFTTETMVGAFFGIFLGVAAATGKG